MTASTTIGEYKVEYDRMGKPTFTDAKGNIVHYKDLKGNELAQANKNYHKLISGKTQDGKTENLSQGLSKDRIQGETLLQNASSRDVPPQSMSKINDYISSLDNMGKEQIKGLKDRLNQIGKQVSKAVKATTKNISNMIKKENQY